LQAIGDVGYVSSLLDGVPDRPSIEHYVKIVRDKALLRGLIHAANTAIARAADQSDAAEEVLSDARLLSSSSRKSALAVASWACRRLSASHSAQWTRCCNAASGITGLATHYENLDEMTSGLQRSDLVIIAARPSMGKTAFAMNIAENAAIKDQQVVGVFSLEMSREALLLRLLCSTAKWMRTRCARGHCGRTIPRNWCEPWSNWPTRPSLSMTRRAFR